MGVSKNKSDEMTNLLKIMMKEIAIQIDLFYENEDIAFLANEDSLFRAFRRGAQWMKDNQIELSEAVIHLQGRIERCHTEYFGTTLEDPEISL